jgi:hypothetical protein
MRKGARRPDEQPALKSVRASSPPGCARALLLGELGQVAANAVGGGDWGARGHRGWAAHHRQVTAAHRVPCSRRTRSLQGPERRVHHQGESKEPRVGAAGSRSIDSQRRCTRDPSFNRLGVALLAAGAGTALADGPGPGDLIGRRPQPRAEQPLAVHQALKQRNDLIRKLRAQVATLRAQRDAARQVASKRGAKSVTDGQTIATLAAQVTGLQTQANSLQAQLNGMIGSLEQQANVVSTPQAWNLVQILYSRFPGDPLGTYSANSFSSGSYRSITFTFAP